MNQRIITKHAKLPYSIQEAVTCSFHHCELPNPYWDMWDIPQELSPRSPDKKRELAGCSDIPTSNGVTCQLPTVRPEMLHFSMVIQVSLPLGSYKKWCLGPGSCRIFEPSKLDQIDMVVLPKAATLANDMGWFSMKLDYRFIYNSWERIPTPLAPGCRISLIKNQWPNTTGIKASLKVLECIYCRISRVRLDDGYAGLPFWYQKTLKFFHSLSHGDPLSSALNARQCRYIIQQYEMWMVQSLQSYTNFIHQHEATVNRSVPACSCSAKTGFVWLGRGYNRMPSEIRENRLPIWRCKNI